MKLALYMPNFRDKITVAEIDEFASVAEELDFDSIWTLDRIVVPESSDTGEMQKPFGFQDALGYQMPVSSRGEFLHGLPLIPYLAAKTKKIRLGTSIIVTGLRAPGVMAAEIGTWDHLSGGRINVGVGSGWMPEEFDAASATDIYKRRNKHVIETIEIMQGIWTNEVFEYHGEFADFERCGFGAKPLQKPRPPMYMSGMNRTDIAAKRLAKYGMEGWIGIMNTPASIKQWRSAMAEELDKIEGSYSIDNLEISSMLPFEITSEATDQTDVGIVTPNMVGTAEQITENLIKYKDAGLTMPMLWPPFAGTPSSKTIDDMHQLKQEILPNIE